MAIRRAQPADLPALEAAIPTGPNRWHEQRLRRQERGLSTYLVAWDGDRPVGHGEIRWAGCDAPEVAARFAGCPEVNGLLVWPPERRGGGIGTALLTAAEGAVRARGLDRIGLGVDDTNPRARALYLRRGYRDLDCPYLDRYSYVLADGSAHEATEAARFLVKDLPPPS